MFEFSTRPMFNVGDSARKALERAYMPPADNTSGVGGLPILRTLRVENFAGLQQQYKALTADTGNASLVFSGVSLDMLSKQSTSAETSGNM